MKTNTEHDEITRYRQIADGYKAVIDEAFESIRDTNNPNENFDVAVRRISYELTNAKKTITDLRERLASQILRSIS